MKINYLHIVALTVAALATQRLAAQSDATPGTSCMYAKSAPWIQRQALFFDDSKHNWSDDTLRTSLLNAAGNKR